MRVHSHMCAQYAATLVHTHTYTHTHLFTHTDQTQVHLPDQEVDADDTLRLGAPAPGHHCGLGLGPQVATTPCQEAIPPGYCLSLAQHWGGGRGGLRGTEGAPGERRLWGQGVRHEEPGRPGFLGDRGAGS